MTHDAPIPGIHGNHPTTEWLHEAVRTPTSVQAPTATVEWPTPRRRPCPPVPAVERPAWLRAALDSLALARAAVLAEAPDPAAAIAHMRDAAAAVKQAPRAQGERR